MVYGLDRVTHTIVFHPFGYRKFLFKLDLLKATDSVIQWMAPDTLRDCDEVFETGITHQLFWKNTMLFA